MKNTTSLSTSLLPLHFPSPSPSNFVSFNVVPIRCSFTTRYDDTRRIALIRNAEHLSQKVVVFRIRAANSVPGSLDGEDDGKISETSEGWATIKLGLLFGTWYLFNIYFNIYDKQVLKVYPFPITITAVHLGIGTLLVLLMWATNLHKKPKISSKLLMAILPLAIVHTLGNLFTNMSLGKVSVSFTHTIKALEPFFTVLLSGLFLGQKPTFLVLSSLIPIVGGVLLASFTEASFNWGGFWSAMASNLANQSRNVLSKGLMVKKEESMDNVTLFSVITIMSFLLVVPLLLFTEGINVITPSYIQSLGLNIHEIYTRTLLAGLCFHAYQQVAYMILAKVSPVTHSVGNCVKRVVVIVASVIFFKTPISLINALGTGAALLGVLFYSRVNRIRPKTKSA